MRDPPSEMSVVEPTKKAYKVLVDALHEVDKVALARFVMRSKQYLAAVRSTGTHLVMSTMVYADEVNDPATVRPPGPQGPTGLATGG